jgi:hypothetical protein
LVASAAFCGFLRLAAGLALFGDLLIFGAMKSEELIQNLSLFAGDDGRVLDKV